MAGVSTHGMAELLRDLERASATVTDEAAKVMGKGANNIKKAWRARWSGHPDIRALPFAIGYDVTQHGFLIETEIGVDKDRPQGPLGNLIEYGSVNNAPIPAGMPALEAEVPAVERYLADLGVKLLEGRR